MYGTQHFFLSFLTVLIITCPLLILTGDLSLWFIPIAAGFGAFMPDVDASDATIKHDNIRGTGRYVGIKLGGAINGLFGRTMPIVGLITTWLAYKPYSMLMKTKEEHRGAFHSLYAALFTAFVFMVVFSLVLLSFKSFSIIVALCVFFGVFLGFSLHLVEDSCTVEGIDFLYPRQSFYVRGEHKTFGDAQTAPNIHIFVLLGMVIMEIAIWFFQRSVEWLQGAMMYLVQFGVVLLLLLLWAVFMWFFYKARRSEIAQANP